MEPTVRALLRKVDELVANATAIIAEIRTVTEQLEPERPAPAAARSRWPT